MSYNRMVCRTPEGLKTHDFTQWPADVPFAVALTPDSFEPWTQTSHMFRFYKQPSITKIEPELVEVGRITEVMVAIERDESDTSPESQENVFFEPIPSQSLRDESEEEDAALQLGSFVMIKCSFGRFGETPAVFVNSTHIRCMTPSVPDDPQDIAVEEVDFLITMNGFDYDLNNSDQKFFIF